MSKEILVAVEGLVDKTLIKFLIEKIYQNIRENLNNSISSSSQVSIERSNGISNVLNSIRDFDGDCIGIIDQDKIKRMPAEIKKFINCQNDKLYEHFKSNLLEVIFKNDNGHFKYLIILKNGHEVWIDNCCDSIGCKRTDFSLPANFKDFTKLSKSKEQKSQAKMENAIKKLYKQRALPLLQYRRILFKIISHHLNFNDPS